MSRVWWIVLLVLGIIGGVAIWQHTQQPMESYTTFTSQQLNVRFEYPVGWTVRDASGSAGHGTGEVQIFGPRRDDLRYSLYLDVRAEPLARSASQPTTLEAAVNASLEQRKKLPSYHILEQTPIRCAGHAAARVLAGYQLPLPLEAATRQSVEFRELVAYCVHEGSVFRLTYAAPQENFEQHRHAFERLVKTFTFLSS